MVRSNKLLVIMEVDRAKRENFTQHGDGSISISHFPIIPTNPADVFFPRLRPLDRPLLTVVTVQSVLASTY